MPWCCGYVAKDKKKESSSWIKKENYVIDIPSGPAQVGSEEWAETEQDWHHQVMAVAVWRARGAHDTLPSAYAGV